MTTSTTVPYSSLIPSDEINARTKTNEALDELAASIAAKGLIQPLAVRPADAGASGKGAQRYEIIDGRRRYQALTALVKAKTLKRDVAVPVLIRDEDDAEALETSLAANTVRLPMHPIDQHEVFARIAEQGTTPAEIAARFGIAERTVRQHMALGRLAPEVRQAWRKGRIDAECAKAFAIEPDQATQAAVLSDLGSRVQEWAVRARLSDRRERVDMSDELALVGEEAYLAAGGTIDEDLFSEARYVANVPLARRLATERLEAECERLRKDGWAWAEIKDEDGDLDPWGMSHVRGEDGDFDAPEAEYSAAEKARSGCLVSTGWKKGEVLIETGLIRPDDAGEDDAQADLEEYIDDDRGGDVVAPDAAPAGIDDDDDAPRLSSALVESLTTQQTIVAQRVLARDPKLALKALLATWIGDRGYGSSPLRVTRYGYRPGMRALSSATSSFAEQLKLNFNDVDVISVALAPRIAEALDLRTYNPSSTRPDAMALVGAMAADDYLREMREVFSAADYFARVPKALAIEALEEMHDGGHHFGLPSRADLERMKKGELAQWAAEQAAGCGWLPKILRHPSYALIIAEKPERERRRAGKMAAAEQSSEPDSPAPARAKRKGRAAA